MNIGRHFSGSEKTVIDVFTDTNIELRGPAVWLTIYTNDTQLSTELYNDTRDFLELDLKTRSGTF